MPPFSIYLCPNYITYRELAISKSSPTNNDHFDHKNWSAQKKKHKVLKQVYRVKIDGRLNKNLDLTLGKEKPTVEETSASFVNEVVTNKDHTSNDIAEAQSSSAGGQGEKKEADSKLTCLTGSRGGLTGATGLTGTQTGLAGVSSGSESKFLHSKKQSKAELQGALVQI